MSDPNVNLNHPEAEPLKVRKGIVSRLVKMLTKVALKVSEVQFQTAVALVITEAKNPSKKGIEKFQAVANALTSVLPDRASFVLKTLVQVVYFYAVVTEAINGPDR